MIAARKFKVLRAEVMFVTIQRENNRPSKKEKNKAVTMLKLSEVLQLGYESPRLYIADQ
jgi:sRNA-binding carbon storage regulator CsrA